MLLIFGVTSYALSGQVMGDHALHFFFDADIKFGTITPNCTSIPLASNYPALVNPYEGKLKFTNATSFGYNAQFGYYFGNNSHFGISAGLLYLTQQGNVSMDTFHIEYKATDYKGNTFRQVISSDKGIHESYSALNVNIPLLLRYRQAFSDKISWTLDAGVLCNIQMQNNYNSNSRFDYEAIYQLQGTGTNLTYVYDNGSHPGAQDWLITKAEFTKDNPKGNIQDYFNSLKTVGFNVGLNQDIAKKSGQVMYQMTSLGIMLQTGINIKLNGRTELKVGAYYLSQSFSNPANTKRLLLTNNLGDYNSLLNYIKNIQSDNAGFTLGINFLFYSYKDRTYSESYEETRK